MTTEMADGALAVKVLRSSKRADTYLYMREMDEYLDLPEALQSQFGEAEAFLSFELTAERTLAIADAEAVLRAILEQGFYLQMPVDPVRLNQMMKPE